MDVLSYKTIFCRGFVDDIDSRRKLVDNVVFDQLNSYRYKQIYHRNKS